MKKDSIYWAYIRTQLLESFSTLEEAERKFSSYNLEFQIANNMAHSGSSKDEIHDHMSQFIGDTYNHDAYMHWYAYGGETPVGSYLRNIAKINFSMGDSVHHPMIDGIHMHQNMVNTNSRVLMNRIYSSAKKEHEKLITEPEIKIYRGVGMIGDNQYKPHALESWTTDINTARKFANMSHIKDAEPHVYSATVNRDDILLSHKLRHIFGFIPPEERLVGKEEFIPLGHKIKNIERIE